MTEPLFDAADLLAVELERREHQGCDGCAYLAWASDDALRARGWLVYDGKSETGQPLHVRTCPACQRRAQAEIRQQSESALRSAGLHQEPLPLA